MFIYSFIDLRGSIAEVILGEQNGPENDLSSFIHALPDLRHRRVASNDKRRRRAHWGRGGGSDGQYMHAEEISTVNMSTSNSRSRLVPNRPSHLS